MKLLAAAIAALGLLALSGAAQADGCSGGAHDGQQSSKPSPTIGS